MLRNMMALLHCNKWLNVLKNYKELSDVAIKGGLLNGYISNCDALIEYFGDEKLINWCFSLQTCAIHLLKNISIYFPFISCIEHDQFGTPQFSAKKVRLLTYNKFILQHIQDLQISLVIVPDLVLLTSPFWLTVCQTTRNRPTAHHGLLH